MSDQVSWLAGVGGLRPFFHVIEAEAFMYFSRSWRQASLVGLSVALLSACGGPSPTDSIANGKAHLQSRDFASAVIDLKNALGNDPSRSETRYLLGVALREVGQLNQALIEFRKARELGFDPNVLIPQIVSTLVQSGAFKEAIAEIDSAELTQAAARNELAFLRGEALSFSGNPGAAKEFYRAASSGDLDHAFARARLAVLDQDFDTALTQVNKVLVERPFDVSARMLKARILSLKGQKSEAAELYERIMRDSPGDTRGYTSGISELIDAKQLDRAANAVDAFSKTFPGTPLAQYLQAQLLHGRGENSQAREAMLQVVKAFPDDYGAHYLLGSIEYSLQNDVSAERHLSRALVMAPENARIRQMLVSTYVRLGQFAEAGSTLKPLLAQRSLSPETLALAGDVAIGARDYKAAESYFLRALSEKPRDPGILLQLGRARLRMGRISEATQSLDEAVAMDPKLVSAEALFVDYYLLKREPDKALQAAQRAMTRAPELPETHNMLGLALMGTKDPTAARRAFEAALQSSETYIPALQNITRLDLAERRFEAAESRLRAVYEKHPRNEPLAFQYATFMAQKSKDTNLPTVVSVLDEIITQNPASVRIRLLKIDRLMKAGDAKAAVDAAEVAEAMAPGEPAILYSLARAQQASRNFSAARTTYGKLAVSMKRSATPHLGLAEVYAAENNWRDARTAALRAIEADADNLTARIALVNLDLQSGQLDLARQSSRAIQSRWPTLGEGFVAEGKVLAAQKAFEEAETVLRRGIDATQDPALVARLYAFLLEREKADAADKLVNAWFAKHPGDPRILVSAGDSRLARGDHAAAERWYRKALAVAPASPGVLNNLAWALGMQRSSEAIAFIDKALVLNPAEPAILDTAGWLHTEMGDVSKAVAYLQEATDAKPDDVSIRIHLARALAKAGDRERASAEVERATKGLTTAAQKSEIARLRSELRD